MMVSLIFVYQSFSIIADSIKAKALIESAIIDFIDRLKLGSLMVTKRRVKRKKREKKKRTKKKNKSNVIEKKIHSNY